jgi:ABC-type Fe3+ transport system substrate-binding protein
MQRPNRRPTPRLSRRAFLQSATLAGSAALLGACQPQAPGAAAPGQGAAPAPAAPAAPAPAAWEAQWNDLLAAARQEGKLVVGGPPSPNTRTSIPARFRERYGIEVEYLGYPPNQGEFIERLIRERAAGVNSVDAFIGGAQSIYTIAYPAGITAPIRPVLIHPEALDGSKWRQGKVWFKDPEEAYFMQVTEQVSGHLVLNTDYVKPSEITSWQSLLDPRYTGRISVWDPTVPGTGWNTANWLRITFGDDYLKQLYVDQRPAIPTDVRQWADWLARGAYPIAVGIAYRDYEGLRKDGFPIEPLQHFPEAPGTTTGAFGVAVLLENAPHPNAARVFMNWMAMREGQETWARGEQGAAARLDVDNSWVAPHMVPQRGVAYLDGYEWNYVQTAFPEAIPKIRQMMALRQ